MEEKFKNLLNQVAVINKKNAEILDATGGKFNMFQICGVNHYENTHSSIIAEFLNPKGSHGLKAKLLKAFFETLGTNFKLNNFDFENAEVYREHPANDGRIDILIKDNKQASIIENKIYADDQWEQLKRYDVFAKQNWEENYQILYLTLDGKEASEQSGKDVDYYLPISYKETIINWLDKCVSISVRHPMVRETINQYINHLKQLTHQDMDTKNKEEIVNLILSNQNFIQSAQEIKDTWGACESKIISNLKSSIEKIANELKLKSELKNSDSLGEKQTSFTFSKNGWKGCWIDYEFGNHDVINVGVKSKELPEETIQDLVTSCSQDGYKKWGGGWIIIKPFNEWNNANWIVRAGDKISIAIQEETKALVDKLDKIFQDKTE